MGQLTEAQRNAANAALTKLNGELATQGKTLQDAEHDDRTEALARMKALTNDPKYRKDWNKTVT